VEHALKKPAPLARTLSGLERATGLLLFVMVIFAPWAFGTTKPWAIQAMNRAGFTLGVLWLVKLALRWFAPSPQVRSDDSGQRVTFGLAAVSMLVLLYVLVSAWNAEFIYVASEWRADPHPHVNWLPHSLDQAATWRVFWNWLALMLTFWAARDWLVNDRDGDGRLRSTRLRLLIWVLAGNAALVALEGILQRADGTAKLLWFQPTRENSFSTAQFGPFAYRSNAAQFFNLIWPVALGLWWRLHRQEKSGRRSQRYHWLWPCIILMVAGPLVSMSRGGVAVTLLQLCACAALMVVRREATPASRLGVILVFVVTLGAASYLGWDQLAPRLRGSPEDLLSGRSETYRLAERMARDYPLFGVGPGAFDSVFQVYRQSPTDYWPAQLHNDWLEYRITFGWLGCGLLMLAGVLVASGWFWTGGLIHEPGGFVAFVWIALAGALLHARFDFPLQIYSIEFVFVLLGAILFSVSRPARRVRN